MDNVLKIEDILKEGSLLSVEKIITDGEKITSAWDQTTFENYIKGQLVSKLIVEMFNNKQILFTKTKDIDKFETKYYARIFIVSPDHVKIIKDANQMK